MFQSLNGSKEDKRGRPTLFPRHSKYEDDFVTDSVCVKQVVQNKSRHTVSCMDFIGTEEFRRSPSLRILFDEEDSDDHEVEKAMEEDYSFGDSDEGEIMSCRPNKNVDDEIDQLTGEFRSHVVKAIYGETGDLHNSTPPPTKSLELKITMDVVQRTSNSSNNYSNPSAHQRSKSVFSEPMNSPFQSRKTDGSKENEAHQNDAGRSSLPLPPRLREASHRNPLSLTLQRKNSVTAQPTSSVEKLFESTSCVEQLFEPNIEPAPRHNVQSRLSKIVKKPKDLSVKLWKNNLDLIRKSRKNPEPQLPSPASSRPSPHERPDCRLNWIQSLQLKLKIKSADVMQAPATLCASRRTFD